MSDTSLRARPDLRHPAVTGSSAEFGQADVRRTSGIGPTAPVDRARKKTSSVFAHGMPGERYSSTKSGILDYRPLGRPDKRHPSLAVAASAQPSPIGELRPWRGRQARGRKTVALLRLRPRGGDLAIGARGLQTSQAEPTAASDRRIDWTL